LSKIKILLIELVSDREGAKRLLKNKKLKTVKKERADSAYAGEDQKAVARKHGKDLEVDKRPTGRMRIYNEQWRAEWIPVERGFTVFPRRWVVERTFAWMGRYRRMSKDYEYLSNTSKTMIYLSMTKTMLNRYAKIT
jgi:putative transposase